MGAADARAAYDRVDTGKSKWGIDSGNKEAEGTYRMGSTSDPALCTRVEKLASEVSELRGSIHSIEQLLRQALPSPQSRATLPARRHSEANALEQTTRQLLAAAAGTRASGSAPALLAATLPAVAVCAPAATGARVDARPLNNLEA